ncbi:hypothetical protein BDV36DRAFT_250319 [Aspergillus pseudocaelatus]|uniref:Uncharacterized protein n=1 Tax=Aspergillus pseudocaelatus TaxID=1825620 RepID=A0ABQ6WTS1_9EURO|nr:hypothetical protein BDV36DRAFT_250319 [Aspergillus pseudocaelatus]
MVLKSSQTRESLDAAVGDALLAVLPQDERPWWKKLHLLKLNLILLNCMYSLLQMVMMAP